MSASSHAVPVALVGDGEVVPCIDGVARPYLNLDAAASTSALPAVARRVADFLPTYASVHRGAGYRSRQATAAFEAARQTALTFAGRGDGDGDVAIFCRNTTEAINHLAYRLRLEPHDVVATTVIEHHANLLPWARLCDRRFVECGVAGTFTVEGIPRALVAARLSAEFGIGVRHGCFCAHPYLLRLLGLSPAEVAAYREAVLAGDRRTIPGAVRASAGLSTSADDVDRFISALGRIVSDAAPTVDYHQDPRTGDYWPDTDQPGWTPEDRGEGAPCARG